jgi:hypothetical protein
LALPDSFTDDLGLFWELFEAIGPADEIPFAVDIESPDLFVVSKPGDYSAIASVAALFDFAPEDADLTMQDWVDYALADIQYMFEDVEILSEDIGKNRADVVAVGYYDPSPGSGQSPEMVRSLRRFVILTGGESGFLWYCQVQYTYEGEQDQALDQVFETSAQTIEVTD